MNNEAKEKNFVTGKRFQLDRSRFPRTVPKKSTKNEDTDCSPSNLPKNTSENKRRGWRIPICLTPSKIAKIIKEETPPPEMIDDINSKNSENENVVISRTSAPKESVITVTQYFSNLDEYYPTTYSFEEICETSPETMTKLINTEEEPEMQLDLQPEVEFEKPSCKKLPREDEEPMMQIKNNEGEETEDIIERIKVFEIAKFTQANQPMMANESATSNARHKDCNPSKNISESILSLNNSATFSNRLRASPNRENLNVSSGMSNNSKKVTRVTKVLDRLRGRRRYIQKIKKPSGAPSEKTIKISEPKRMTKLIEMAEEPEVKIMEPSCSKFPGETEEPLMPIKNEMEEETEEFINEQIEAVEISKFTPTYQPTMVTNKSATVSSDTCHGIRRPSENTTEKSNCSSYNSTSSKCLASPNERNRNVSLGKCKTSRRVLELVEAPFLPKGEHRGHSCNIQRIEKSSGEPSKETMKVSEPNLIMISKVNEKLHLQERRKRLITHKFDDCLSAGKKSLTKLPQSEGLIIHENRKEKLEQFVYNKPIEITKDLSAEMITIEDVTPETTGYRLSIHEMEMNLAEEPRGEPMEPHAHASKKKQTIDEYSGRGNSQNQCTISQEDLNYLSINVTAPTMPIFGGIESVDEINLEPYTKENTIRNNNINLLNAARTSLNNFNVRVPRSNEEDHKKSIKARKADNLKSLERVLSRILTWNPAWLEGNNRNLEMESLIIDEKSLRPMLINYSTQKEYCDITEPLLELEAWSALTKCYECKKSRKNGLFDYFVVKIFEHHNDDARIAKIKVELVVPVWNQAKPSSGDLVIFRCQTNIGMVKAFGYVWSVVEKIKKQNRKFNAELEHPTEMVLTYTVLTSQLYLRQITRNLDRTLSAISNLRSHMRIIKALHYLPASPLSKYILHPKIEEYQLPNADTLTCYPLVVKAKLNAKQLKAVTKIATVVQQNLPKICLIHGPPGTGKSKVIVNLITQILYGDDTRFIDSDSKILVCAPSNAAIDEIVARLLKIRQSLENENPFEIVRIGQLDAMQDYAQKVSLSELVTQEQKRLSSTEGSLRQPLKHFEYEVLKRTHVIASTLASSYTNYMESHFNSGPLRDTIRLCIVDEATQCTEAETLIPLMFGAGTLVLVGDTNQLPATILSQKAKMFGLDQSLFSRVEKAFHDQKDNPIILLDTQYRMSYPVAHWPNKYFYGGILKNSAKLRNLPFHFYKVIDLNSEENLSKFSNTNEASFVTNIVYTLAVKSKIDNANLPVTVGIITPYNEQKTLIRTRLDARISPLSEMLKAKIVYDVNTVDAFQGQERDLIIMSCVRSNGIGFLSDCHRLCVALTRAKHGVILCGNFKTFRRNHMWNALLVDAEARGVYIKMDWNVDLEKMKRHIIR